jgi:hypothetical protein
LVLIAERYFESPKISIKKKMQFLCIFNWKKRPNKIIPLMVQLFLQTVDVGAHPKNKAREDRYK